MRDKPADPLDAIAEDQEQELRDQIAYLTSQAHKPITEGQAVAMFTKFVTGAFGRSRSKAIPPWAPLRASWLRSFAKKGAGDTDAEHADAVARGKECQFAIAKVDRKVLTAIVERIWNASGK